MARSKTMATSEEPKKKTAGARSQDQESLMAFRDIPSLDDLPEDLPWEDEGSSKAQEPAGDQGSIEENFARLEELCAKLEARDTNLEDSFTLYQEGVALLKACTKKLDMVEKKMLQLNEDGSLGEF